MLRILQRAAPPVEECHETLHLDGRGRIIARPDRERQSMQIVLRCAALALAACVLASVPAYATMDSVIYSFKWGTDGTLPNGGLIDVGGTLYGTAYEGGTGCGGFGCGIIFSVTPDGGENVV
jgi:hypothetical protein